MPNLVPYVIKKGPDGERGMDIYSRLLEDRIIMLDGPFDDTMASLIISQLLFLQSEDATKDVTMYINSPGGSVTAMWSIIDTMDLIKPDVSTICVGFAASAGSFVLANGKKGKRFILPNAQVMIHQPNTPGLGSGSATDIDIRVKELLKTKQKGIDFYVEKTGKDREKIAADIERDFYMEASEAVEYGIVDKIITSAQS